MPPLSSDLFARLPEPAALDRLTDVAATAYGAPSREHVVAAPGTQILLTPVAALVPPGRAAVLGPTYAELSRAATLVGHDVTEVGDIGQLENADLAVVVNPNNPDGRQHDPAKLLALLPHVGRLVVDESFADCVPSLSIAPEAGRPGLIVLRSFGKFYGLAGLRLGFVLGSEADVAAFAGMSGPWPVSGPAIEIGRRALLDRDWADETRARLAHGSARLDRLTRDAGWTLVGGTPLFRLYEAGDAVAAQERLAEAKIWSRIFSDSPGWLRLGLPGSEAEWERLAAALII